MSNGKKFVVALGGSVVCPDKIDANFLRKFSLFIKKEIKRGSKFIFVVGGGTLSRAYQKAISKILKITDEDKDWIGIFATYLNAYFLKTIFKKEAHPFLFNERFKIRDFGKYSIIIASGWRPGWSTDFVAMQIAVDFKIKKVIILGKPSYVYTADYEKDKKAKPIEKMSWEDYLKLISSRWSPGLRLPVDPIAARLAKKEKMKVIVANGKDLKNFRKILRGKKFKGTILA